MTRPPRTRMKGVPLRLAPDELHRLDSWDRAALDQHRRQVYGERERGDRRRYHHPPGGVYLDWSAAARAGDALRKRLNETRRRIVRIKSRVTLPTRAWAWNLRAHKDNLDPLALAILRREELFLCRIVLGIVEHENETIESIDLTISHTPGTNYKLFPTEKHRPSTSLSAKVGGHLAIGLTRGLDIVPAESSNNTLNAHLVWRGDWRWAAAVLKSSGVGHPEARWRLTRLREAPFAGDREFFTILQLPKRSEPGVVSASLSANIQPSGLQKTIFKYEMATDGPIDIPYFVS